MPQVQKTRVREAIERAAERTFAARGYRGATVASIAASAGVSTGNVYRYFRTKQALFNGVVPAAFVAEFERLLDERVATLGALASPAVLDATAAAAQQAMLDFWTANRLKVVILLDRAAGSHLGDYGRAFEQRLVRQAVLSLKSRTLNSVGSIDVGELPAVVEPTLAVVFGGARRAIVAALEDYSSAADIAAALEAFWQFQLAGLAGFFQWVIDD